MEDMLTIKNIRELTNLSREQLAFRYQIPLDLLTSWEEGTIEPPKYLHKILYNALSYDGHLEYIPISPTEIKPVFDINPIIDPADWQEKHPHFTASVEMLDCGCHGKLLGAKLKK
jgi:hypothetical protein